jgi:hypothetical protein
MFTKQFEKTIRIKHSNMQELKYVDNSLVTFGQFLNSYGEKKHYPKALNK